MASRGAKRSRARAEAEAAAADVQMQLTASADRCAELENKVDYLREIHSVASQARTHTCTHPHLCAHGRMHA